MDHPIILIAFGLFVGVFSGVMGLGGGAVMIPIMVLAMGLSQTKAHGTSLAVMIPPVTIPAVIAYWRKGEVDFRLAAWMALGVACGTFFGGLIATSLPRETLKLIFGFVLVYIAGYTIFGRENLVRTLILAGLLVAVAGVMLAGTKVADERSDRGSPPLVQ